MSEIGTVKRYYSAASLELIFKERSILESIMLTASALHHVLCSSVGTDKTKVMLGNAIEDCLKKGKISAEEKRFLTNFAHLRNSPAHKTGDVMAFSTFPEQMRSFCRPFIEPVWIFLSTSERKDLMSADELAFTTVHE